ncbi:MAG: hypothetical protein CVV41_15635 [Candidatus Riflebacteria bacterium HGW-Riflebacteria-1]|jgi:hypothetical protein|nr:MAG: hypothetical protein CVV41_15635 [Candidatus Riflebacteria bacterium HGW-Riflebacteria-1]
MKKMLLICCFMLACLSSYALEPGDVEITDSAQELEIKKNKFLAIEEQDLVQYESIANQIDRALAAEVAPDSAIIGLKANFNSYATRRLNMIRKVFSLFRNEFSNLTGVLESLPDNRLPAYIEFIKVLDESLNEAKMKGSKEKWQDLKNRAKALLNRASMESAVRQYKDRLILSSDDSKTGYLEAKIRLLHRWLLEGMFAEATPLVAELAVKYPDHALCLGLQAHYWFEDYRQCVPSLDLKAELEKKISQQYGGAMTVTITLKGEKSLQKAFLFYLEALQKGYPPEREIPGLMPAYWQYVEVMYKKIHPYWRYPTSLKGFSDMAKDLASRCRAIAEFVPFKKYASPAYQILSDIYRYWPEDKFGPKIIDYREIMRLSMIVSKKSL